MLTRTDYILLTLSAIGAALVLFTIEVLIQSTGVM